MSQCDPCVHGMMPAACPLCLGAEAWKPSRVNPDDNQTPAPATDYGVLLSNIRAEAEDVDRLDDMDSTVAILRAAADAIAELARINEYLARRAEQAESRADQLAAEVAAWKAIDHSPAHAQARIDALEQQRDEARASETHWREIAQGVGIKAFDAEADVVRLGVIIDHLNEDRDYWKVRQERAESRADRVVGLLKECWSFLDTVDWDDNTADEACNLKETIDAALAEREGA